MILQVQAFEEPSVYEMEPELSIALLALSEKVQVGVWMASEAVKLRVITSPSLALPVPASSIETEDRVGWVLSIVTLVESVTSVTVVPALSASSEKAIENVIAPSGSEL